jgi:hypothetical protein
MSFKKKENRNEKKTQTRNNQKLISLSPNPSIITLNINGLDALVL